MRQLTWLVWVPIMVGCQEAPRAPLDLEGASTFLFTNFDGDAEALGLALEDLNASLDGIDLAADSRADRSFSLDVVRGEALGGLTQPEGTVAEDQIPGLVVGRSIHDYAANLAIAGEPNQVCIESNTTVFYGRTFVTSEADFISGASDRLETTNEVRKENLLAKAWYDLFKDYRRIVMPGSGEEAIIARSWTEEVFLGDNGSNEFAQNFTIEAWIADGTETRRMYGIWAEINIGLGDDFMQNTILDGLNEGMINADGFISDDLSNCTADRDRAYDRPQE